MFDLQWKNTSNWKNLVQHYQLKYPTDLIIQQQINVSQSQATIMLINTTLGVEKKQYWSQKASKLSIAVGSRGNGGLPLIVVEKKILAEIFCRLYSHLSHLSATIITCWFLRNKRAVRSTRNELALSKRQPSVTVDCWTNQNNLSYFARTAHYYSQNEKLRSTALFLVELESHQTASNIRTKWNDIDEYDSFPDDN